MSGKEQKDVSPERMTDLPSFEGKKFADHICPTCQLHLAVIGQGICVPCITLADLPDEALTFDPELEDVIHGLGAAEVW